MVRESMIHRLLTSAFLFVLCLLLAQTGTAQQAPDYLAQGRQAFREARFEEAARAFEQATASDPQNAEAHYLLARVYYETPLHDRRKAARALDKALDIEPENVVYLVAQLQQLRTETNNFFAERLRELRRLELASKILDLDPENAFANEELGAVHIHDFWRYRNAVMIPTYALQYTSLQEGAGRFDYQAENVGVAERFIPTGNNLERIANPNRVFLNDRFDTESLASQGVPIRDLEVRAQRSYDRAITHLQKALEVDPRRRSVYDLLMEIYSLKGEYTEALVMLEDMYRFFPEDPETWTYLGLAHHRAGNFEASERSFETAFRFMDPAVKEAYTDIRYVLPQEEIKAYEADPVTYASRFWTSKDPRYLTPYNERRQEHYSRLTYADLLYGADGLDLRGWDTQRGRILVRYGPPEADVVIIPNDEAIHEGKTILIEALTTVGEGDLNNSGASAVRNDPQEMRDLMDSQLFNEMNTFNVWEYGEFRFVFEDPFRNGEYRLYTPKASEISDGMDVWENDYEIKAKETFRRTPERYEYEPTGRAVELPYLTTAFKGEGGVTDLYVHYGVPITTFDNGEQMLEITANTGTFLVSEQRDLLVERRRTIYGLPTEQIVSFTDLNLWVDTQTMTAPPGHHELSMEFETASGGTVAVQRRPVDIPDFSSGELGISDLLLAYRVEDTFDGKPHSASEIVRHDLSIQPAPWSVFSTNQPVYLYFEAYNLAKGDDGQTDYEVDIVLIPKEESRGLGRLVKNIFGRTGGVSVSFPGTGTLSDDAAYQILDVSGEEPGIYTLAIRVHDNISGKTVESEQDLFLE